MLRTLALVFILLALALPPCTAVDVVIYNGDPDSGSQICRHLPPGICCRALPATFQYYNNPFHPDYVMVSRLQPLDVGAIWTRRGRIGGCSGIPVATRHGPGSMGYTATGDERALGASYIRMPTALPPGEREANWLSAEGMLGLVWGGGKWFADGVSSAGSGGPRGGKRLARRGVIRGEVGMAYIRAPSRWRWPDMVEINGTIHVDARTAEGLYQSSSGDVLNLMGKD